MQEWEERNQQTHAEKTDEPKEVSHVDTGLISDPSLHKGDIYSIHDRTRKGQKVTGGNFAVRLVGEKASIFVITGQVID